jgi:parallel beta-helix repeat protein
MLKLITILFVCLLPFFGTTQVIHYVSSSDGNDSNDGLNTNSAWKTIDKANTITPAPGDKILFKRGDTFYGALIISNSGSSDNPITIGAYGTGAKPIITGLQTLSSWVDNGGGIYKVSFSKSRLEVVSFNGSPQGMGRWPNIGSWRTYNASSSTTITDANTLTGSWVGAEATIRKTRWTLDRNLITGQSGNTLTFTPAGSGNVPSNGCGYFIQNSLATLDTLGEWYNDGSNLYMYFGANSPSSYTVKVASIDNLLWLNHADYVTIKNIQFNGSDSCGVVTNVATNLTVDSCDFNLQGIAGVQLGWGSTNTTISNCTFNNSYTNAITFANNCAHANVSNNTAQNTNIIYGSGSKVSWDNLGDAIVINSDSATASNNTVINAGHNGIRLSGLKILCENNDISNVGLTRYDVGGIYTWVETHDMTGTIIRNNNIHDCMGTDIMWLDNPFVSVEGIYLDDTKGVSILSNTITNVDNRGINLNNYDNVEVHDNTVTDARGSSLALTPFSSTTMAANITRNTFVTTHAPVAYYDLGITVQPTNYSFTTFSSSHHTTFPNVGIVDSNHFYRTSSSEVLFNTSLSGDVHWYGTNRTLSDWQTFTGLDAHSDMTVGTPTPPVAAPTISLSGDQTITDDHTTLFATPVWASEHNGSVLWTKISGPGATTIAPSGYNATVSNLQTGTYVFRCTAIQDDGQSVYKEVTITVSINIPPVADAGKAQTIQLPANYIFINKN